MEFVDSHCHLDDQQFAKDLPETIERAREAGIKYMLTIGTGEGPPDLEAAVRLAEAYPFIYATVGVHPNDALKVGGDTFAHLERLLAHRKVRAIGEIGLDYHWGVPKEAQTPIFVRQLEIARESRVPVIIHTRDAWEDTLKVLRSHWADTDGTCIFHCFTGTAEQARVCLDMGFYLSFGGVASFPKAADIREAARIAPADRLLLETDCPYLAPVPYRGKRNEPAFLVKTAEVIAEVRGVTVEELAAQTTANSQRLFKIEERQAPV